MFATNQLIAFESNRKMQNAIIPFLFAILPGSSIS